MALVRSLLGAKKILGRSVTAASTSKRTTSAAPKGFLAVYGGYPLQVSDLGRPLNKAISCVFKLKFEASEKQIDAQIQGLTREKVDLFTLNNLSLTQE
ncbi:unnamed protein product [Brassica napus]|uniref:(rape) hypothetical protein n=1 Tax=Brassica napus TaxID=3708 RepID=A0A816V6S1_BRANA|nr:unnamed protein product [Brassica napus]